MRSAALVSVPVSAPFMCMMWRPTKTTDLRNLLREEMALVKEIGVEEKEPQESKP